MWGTSGTERGRVGVIAHELGHFIGSLNDLYDTDGPGYGSGVGSFSLMANAWGFDASQNNPPLMDCWSRSRLGWVVPTTVSTPGEYEVLAASRQGARCFKVTKVRVRYFLLVWGF